MSSPGGYRRKFTTSVNLNASGQGTARFANNNSAQQYIVEQISVYTNPRQSGVTAEVFLVADLVDTAYFAGTGDTATGPPWLYMSSGEYVDVVWLNGPANGQGVMTAWYQEVMM